MTDDCCPTQQNRIDEPPATDPATELLARDGAIEIESSPPTVRPPDQSEPATDSGPRSMEGATDGAADPATEPATEPRRDPALEPPDLEPPDPDGEYRTVEGATEIEPVTDPYGDSATNSYCGAAVGIRLRAPIAAANWSMDNPALEWEDPGRELEPLCPLYPEYPVMPEATESETSWAAKCSLSYNENCDQMQRMVLPTSSCNESCILMQQTPGLEHVEKRCCIESWSPMRPKQAAQQTEEDSKQAPRCAPARGSNPQERHLPGRGVYISVQLPPARVAGLGGSRDTSQGEGKPYWEG
ncbi:hypothetical protein CKAH01_16476 [Colletotrichum kahawae]|uniref:Uncharacterized protein n=1 Tax=Colletotrichum kahawae TaxID=34407 RepID=A0AAD9YFJ9_COLKA|nr:hypothetical protein CKAH01_16476 [Colletotrichum kahawae]